MTNDKNSTVFDDIVQGLNEIIEHQKGNIDLKSSVVEIPDDEIEVTRMYKKLTDNDKILVKGMINRLLQETPQNII